MSFINSPVFISYLNAGLELLELFKFTLLNNNVVGTPFPIFISLVVTYDIVGTAPIYAAGPVNPVNPV